MTKLGYGLGLLVLVAALAAVWGPTLGFGRGPVELSQLKETLTALGVSKAPVAALSLSPPAVAAVVDAPIASLLKTYGNNELAGDTAYKGKFVRVSGVVKSLRQDFSGRSFVMLGTGKPYETPEFQCFLMARQDAATNLFKGQRIVAVGKVTGLAMNVIAEGCRIESGAD